jgi:hypothetical protein
MEPKMLDPKKIELELKACSLDLLIQRMQKNEVAFKLPVGTAWDKTQQSRLIESLLIKFSIGGFWFDRKYNGEWVVIDGHKRLSAITDFVEGRLILQDLVYMPYNGFTFDMLPRPMQRRIKETTISINLINPGIPDDIRADLFARVERNLNQFT